MWIVDTKGKPGGIFEISVLQDNNEHGTHSDGWFGKDKVYISGSGGPCMDTVDKRIWDKLVKVAKEICEEMNREII